MKPLFFIRKRRDKARNDAPSRRRQRLARKSLETAYANQDYPRFTLGSEITPEQLAFFNKHGFIHFPGFLSAAEVAQVRAELNAIQEQWVQEGRKHVNGIPIFYGQGPDGKPVVHRFPFTSQFSPTLHKIVSDGRLDILKALLGRADARIGEFEKDGTVVNQYINSPQSKMKRMGWHTDSLRDIFYLQKVLPMLNVGLYFTQSQPEQGGLRLLPGTHKQNLYNLFFRKPYYISARPDRREIAIFAQPGDLTVHHGHIWHRVEAAPAQGSSSTRINMYVPIVCGKEKMKHEKSRTPLYLRLRSLAKK